MIRRAAAWLNPARWWDAIRLNPVVLKEMRSRMRGWRSIAAVTAFLILIGGTVGMIYLGFSEVGGGPAGVAVRRSIGQSIFYTIFILQLLLVGITTPALTASSIAAEREHQTYDLLRTTLLSERSLVIGKLLASVAFALLLLVASIPVQSIGFVFGGVALGEVLLGTLILVLTALAYGAIGIFFSSLVHRTRIAAVLTQITTSTLSIGLPILALFALPFFSLALVTVNPVPELLLFAVGWLIAIFSPVATAISTEVILTQEQTYFFFQLPFNGTNVWVPSPWLGFTLLYAGLTVLFIALSVQIVRRPERQ